MNEDHRAVVADGGDEQALGVVGVGGHDHLQAGHVAEPGLEAARVLGRAAAVDARVGGHDDGQRGLAAEHVLHLRHLVDDLVHGHAHEVHDHDLDDGSQAHRRGPDPQAGKRQLRYRRVHHAPIAVLGVKTRVRAERPAHADVLSGDEHPVVPRHFLVDGLCHRSRRRLDSHPAPFDYQL